MSAGASFCATARVYGSGVAEGGGLAFAFGAGPFVAEAHTLASVPVTGVVGPLTAAPLPAGLALAAAAAGCAPDCVAVAARVAVALDELPPPQAASRRAAAASAAASAAGREDLRIMPSPISGARPAARRSYAPARGGSAAVSLRKRAEGNPRRTVRTTCRKAPRRRAPAAAVQRMPKPPDPSG